MIKTLIFDLDGTILDTIYDLKEAVNYSLKTLNHKECSLEEIREFIGNGLTNLMLRSLGKKEVDEEVLKSIDLFTLYYKDHLNVYTKPFEGIKEALTILKQEGFKIAVLSNKDDYAVKILCDYFYPDLIMCKSGRKEDGIIKPHPLLVERTLKELNETTAYFIGDSDTDALTALNFNIPGVLVSWGYEDLEVLKRFNMPIMNNAQELLKFLLKK